MRRLDIGRSLVISKIERIKTEVSIKDPSIVYFCADYKEGETLDCDDLTSLTVGEIERLTDFNLKISCIKDEVVLI